MEEIEHHQDGSRMLSRKNEHHLKIRPMTVDDIAEVQNVGQIAWSDLALRDIGRHFKYPKRSERIIDSYIWSAPEGCIVAEEDGSIIGSAFSHIWGKVGWIGPLEVLPLHQDAGVGKSLLSECEKYLTNKGCEVIGLETMSHLPKQMHFYMSSGFVPQETTLIMEKMVSKDSSDLTVNITELSDKDMDKVMPEISRLSHLVEPHLDYSSEGQGGDIERARGRLCGQIREW